MLSQYTYGPYGDLRAADVRPNHDLPPHAIGHQGLFFVRFDGIPDDPPLETGAKGLYYNRNRWYSPELGRFMQRDVNETALPTVTSLAYHGEAIDAVIAKFDGRQQYSDGLNLFVYLYSNPVARRDALGLFSLPSLSSSAGIASRLYGAYDTASGFKQMIAAFAAGVSAQNVLLGFAIDVAMDKTGGKLLDNLVDFAAPLKKHFSKQYGKGWQNPMKEAAESVRLKPTQRHHFATHYGDYGKKFERIASKYGLNLDDTWNLEDILHQGRHPGEYHEWMMKQFREADAFANGSASAFMTYMDNIFSVVKNYPEMLMKDFWR